MQPEQLVFETDTKFGHYQVVDMVYVGRRARVLFSGQRGAAQSAIPRDGNKTMLFDYNQRFLELIASLGPKNLLLIGGGAFSLPAKVLQNHREILIDVIEQDPALIEISKKFFGLEDNKNLKIIIGDGREYLSKNTKLYDLIIIDAFSGNKIPEALRTLEFANLLPTQLTKNGVCAINVISALHGPNNITLKEQFATYNSVFRHVDIFPADNSITYWVSQNFILTATNKRLRPKYNMKFSSLQKPVVRPENILHD
jgi:spermidine synthase